MRSRRKDIKIDLIFDRLIDSRMPLQVIANIGAAMPTKMNAIGNKAMDAVAVHNAATRTVASIASSVFDGMLCSGSGHNTSANEHPQCAAVAIITAERAAAVPTAVGGSISTMTRSITAHATPTAVVNAV